MKKRMFFYDLNPGFKTAETFIRRFYAKEFEQSVERKGSYEPMKFEGSRERVTIAKKGLDLIRDVWLISNCVDLSDRLSMAASIELRSPFLDYQLHELVLGSQKAVLAYDRPGKYWLKKAMKGILPDEVMTRPKQGFTPPVAEWIKGILQRYLPLLRGGFLTSEQILSKQGANLLMSTWSGLPMYWYAIYQIVLLEIWGREYYYGQTPEEIR